MNLVAYGIPINSQPWAMGPLQMRKKGRDGPSYPIVGPNGVLATYQASVKDHLVAQGAAVQRPGYSLRLWISRQIVQYVSKKKVVTKNQADGTNIFKGTEDALQGVLIENDRHMMQGHWLLQGQDLDIVPSIVIELAYGLDSYDQGFFPPYMTDEGYAAWENLAVEYENSSRITGNEMEY